MIESLIDQQSIKKSKRLLQLLFAACRFHRIVTIQSSSTTNYHEDYSPIDHCLLLLGLWPALGHIGDQKGLDVCQSAGAVESTGTINGGPYRPTHQSGKKTQTNASAMTGSFLLYVQAGEGVLAPSILARAL
jgi:hypothetical protein